VQHAPEAQNGTINRAHCSRSPGRIRGPLAIRNPRRPRRGDRADRRRVAHRRVDRDVPSIPRDRRTPRSLPRQSASEAEPGDGIHNALAACRRFTSAPSSTPRELLAEAGADLDIRVKALLWEESMTWETAVYDVTLWLCGMATTSPSPSSCKQRLGFGRCVIGRPGVRPLGAVRTTLTVTARIESVASSHEDIAAVSAKKRRLPKQPP
jgi:hypothetical protein